MSRKKTEIPDLDVAGLLALKIYERPDVVRTEKSVQSILRGIHAFEKSPSTQVSNRKFGWVFAQPRYGVAALFVFFLGLHLLDRPEPATSMGSSVLEDPSSGMEAMAAVVDTNRTKAASVPGIAPVYNPLADESASFSDYGK